MTVLAQSQIVSPAPSVDCEAVVIPSPNPDSKDATNLEVFAQSSSDLSDDDEFYYRFSTRRKWCIVAVVSLGGFNSNLASQLILPAMPEVASAFHTTGNIINISNALYLLFMGLSTLFWGPLSQIYGRRWVGLVSSIMFFAFSVGGALSPNLVAFFIFRVLCAIMGTAFQVVGSSCVGDIYKPTERGTALSWFLSFTLLGPSIGPFLAGVIVTYEDWRALFWFQSALGGLAALLVVTTLPETGHRKRVDEVKGLSYLAQGAQIVRWVNPLRVIALLRVPKIFLAGLGTASLIWNMQTLLTPIRYVINPRFHLTSPLQSSLFYLAPGAGYICGTFMGGPWADRTVKHWIKRRGKRVPEDRLRSSFVAMGIVIPSSILIYGWTIEKEKGGVPVPVICMFVQGVAQMICLPSLNTYCLEAVPGIGPEVMASSLFIRYSLAAVGTAVCLPGIESIGLGWISTISSLFIVATTCGVCCIVYFLQSQEQ